MDVTILISLIFLYLICVWVIIYNIQDDNRFNVIEKKITIACLLLPPVGILLFILFKIKNRNKKAIKPTSKKRKVVYHGGYQGGHNKPIK